MDDTPPRWQVWRQDDNGARFLIATYPTQEAAQARLSDLERTGGHHKQLYWTTRTDKPPR